MIIPLYGIISHTRSMTQSRIRGILAGFNRGIKRPINLSAFTAHIRLNMDGLKYLVFHPSRVSPCLGSWAFQLGHVFSDMDRLLGARKVETISRFNWATSFQTWIVPDTALLMRRHQCFNWATSFQTWIDPYLQEFKRVR